MSFPRTAVYLNHVSKAYSAVSLLQIQAKRHADSIAFETKYAAELKTAFDRLYKAAQTGAIRMLLKPDDFLVKEEVQAYMRSKGFAYDTRYGGDFTIEWWHAEDALK